MSLPLGFRRAGAPFGFVPMLDDRFRIGREGANDLVVHDLRVSRAHARVRYVKGEVVLAAEEGTSVYVNGRRTPLLALQPGDHVDLLPPDVPGPVRLTFENRLHGAFVAPGTSFVGAWLSLPAFQAGAQGPERYGVAAAAATGAQARGIDPATGQEVVERVGELVARGDDAERAVRVLARWAGGPHPALAHVVDLGLLPSRDGPRPWTALAWVEGTTAADLVERAPRPPPDVLRALAPVAYGLDWLSRRGLVHRDVAPGNVLVRPDGRGVLIDLDSARLKGVESGASRGVLGTPGYLAPEEVLEGGAATGSAADVYGLCAVAYALLTGRAPSAGGDLLSTVAQAAYAPLRPGELGVEVPAALEDLLLEGLARDPARRPSAADLARRLEGVRASLAVEPP